MGRLRRVGATAALLGVTACAPISEGWQLESSRVCPSAEQMRVCLESEPDRGVSARVGGVGLVPGECASRRGDPRRGRAELELEDEQSERQSERVRVRAGSVATLRLTPEGEERALRRCEAGSLLQSDED